MASGGGPTQSTVSQSNLPTYAEPYYKNLMQRAQKESTTNYIPYKKDRIANISDATQSGLGMARNYANSDTGTGAVVNSLGGIADKAGNLSYNGSNYNSQQIGANAVKDVSAQQVGFGKGGLNQVGTEGWNSGAMNKYMSPYMDAVVNRAQQNATDQFGQQQAQRNLEAARTSSFGGSRAAVQNAIAQNQLNNNLTDIYVTGQQSAYENAQNQFNTDTDRFLNADVQNQNTALSMGQGNQKSSLEASLGNQQTGLQRNLANQSAGLDAAKLNEQSRQFGANYGLQGLDLSRSAQMDKLNALGQQDDMMQNRIQAMLGVGQTREDYRQKELDQKYADFVNQRDAERQNLQFLSSILQGVPISPNREVVTSTSQNNLAGILGSMGGLGTLNSMGNQ